ncbi:MAG: phosphatidylglycerophosphatase A [Candidatus Omnitrophica bacterium CG11_big_fil_rev_8_21_14_0_20_64_10]|nr:MAG: phosphatidylglycerophosphatase A [Candidatus Omnitrophica bacterium CG11_big_fil_rev_8_21_14_0_20_64_10]
MSVAIATLFGLGRVAAAPGTVASIVTAVLFILTAAGNPAIQKVGCVLLVMLAVGSAGRAAERLGKKDPSEIVIDEAAGMWVALIFLPARWPVWLAAFVLFRLFDILKPPPLRQLERLPGSAGIVLDDLAAGLLAQLFLRVALTLF